ncbi:uncharacterized protein A4U43_C06F18760 [Asparagus officinalis]|uniref:Uncharacterized protein n=1 Tax=Asparagus officinalis TaxID=4686 RepID=A0A5P1ENC1_ASPOF|nr:uncharacterized protein A4U43_C06F18760 [Asparagus officinalis]
MRNLPLVDYLKRRTRSLTPFDPDLYDRYADSPGDHVSIMLGEVLHIFRCRHLRSFIDCTLGAVIKMHRELEVYVGLDVNPVAHEKGRARIEELLTGSEGLQAYTHLRNFKYVKSVLDGSDEDLLNECVDGVLMDLGISSMQILGAATVFNNARKHPDQVKDMRSHRQPDLTSLWFMSRNGMVSMEQY